MAFPIATEEAGFCICVQELLVECQQQLLLLSEPGQTPGGGGDGDDDHLDIPAVM